MTKSSVQKKKDAKKSKAAVADQLRSLAQQAAEMAANRDAASSAPVAVVEEEALGDVGSRFDERVRKEVAAALPAPSGEDGAGGADAGRRDDNDDDDAVRDAAQAAADDAAAQLSKAQLRKTLRISIEKLKLNARDPTVVELHDANAPEPEFLVYLKSLRNSIPVPRHWLQKSLFLSHQIDREPSDDIVPSFIERTGVAAMRPENGKVDLVALARPYRAGHPKLPLTSFGDVFFEGKDMRARFRRFKPGVLSERLRQALGMTMNAPPPWLYGMQRLKKLPPAYPTLKIPGLNAPLPPGARWGPSKGEWGQPPRREDNSLVFPSVTRDIAAGDDSADLGGGKYWGTAPDSDAALVLAPASLLAPAKPAAPTEVPPPQAAAPAAAAAPFVPQPHQQPQFPRGAPSQQTFAVELQRVQAGYSGAGYMPSSQVFVPTAMAAGASAGQYPPGYPGTYAGAPGAPGGYGPQGQQHGYPQQAPAGYYPPQGQYAPQGPPGAYPQGAAPGYGQYPAAHQQQQQQQPPNPQAGRLDRL